MSSSKKQFACDTLARLLAALLVAHATVGQQSAAEAAQRPNIVLIMADDMGYSDIGCYGGEIDTPTLDSLAAGGVRFTQFYNTGRCCPTRASLLSGLYPHQAGIGWMMTDGGHDGYRGDLNRNCVTIAEALQPAGYSTYAVGKWHVTRHIQPDGPKHNWPLQRGFDRYYGTITGAGSFFDPGTLTRDNTMVSPIADPEYRREQYYYTDAISDHAVRFINEHPGQQGEKPFFMYVAYTCAHWPMHALEKDIAKYRGKYDGGYEPTRAGRLARTKELGLVDPSWDPAPLVGDWESVEHKEWEAACMEVYAAMIDNMDRGIGRIVDALKASGKFDNTLILFLQDNGGCQETVGRRGELRRPAAPSLPKIANDAIRLDVIPKQNRAGVPTLQGPRIMPGPEDTYIAYGLNWANVSNTPFREYKHFVHEGGISTPLVAHWPRGIGGGGRLESQPGHLIDLMATCVDLAGADYPTKRGGETIKPMEGVSLRPAFSGQPLGRESPIFWEHEGNRAVRDGKWKLVAKENKPWELYDMQADRAEMHDLAAEMPERVEQMAAKWDAYAERANVLPLGGWRARNRNTNLNRTQKVFELAAGASLAREKSPFVQGRPLAVTVRVEEMGEGVLVAQGGSSDGYCLYIQDGKPAFAVRRGGELNVVAGENRLGVSSGEISLRLKKGGGVTLLADDKKVASGSVGGLIARMPLDGLQVGRDAKGAVGQYAAEFAFTGRIAGVTVQVGR